MGAQNQHSRAETLASKATIAIITALPIEQAAMKAMLDQPLPLSTAGNAPGEYVLGTIPSKDNALHVVVLACSSIGENLASATASILLERFPSIRDVVMVGIAGGCPIRAGRKRTSATITTRRLSGTAM